MNLNLDTIDIVLLLLIYGGLIILPILNRKKKFPWKAILWGFLIATIFSFLFYLLNLLTVKVFGKPISNMGWKPLNFFFVNIPLLTLIFFFLSYYDKSKTNSTPEENNP